MNTPESPHPTSRVDERDTMFARAERKAGTAAYEDYYGRNPERRLADDRLRAMPEHGTPGGAHYDEGLSGEAVAFFEGIEAIEPDREVAAAWAARLREADDPTETIRRMLLELGAVAAGFSPLEEGYVYTHKGRLDDDYGDAIRLDHPSACVFLVEMDLDAMRRAPKAPVLRESARQYYRGAEISKTVEAALQGAGFAAKAHYDAHYDVILPALAVLAGLGELGRNNILIADRFGSRVRIGAVTTDAPVVHDRPRSLGAAHFCEICLKCADNCPSHALSKGDREDVLGVAKWPTQIERCYGYWRQVGTDCGICMACCPFSHQDNLFHRMVRVLVKRVPFLHPVLKWFDDRVYGRHWTPR